MLPSTQPSTIASLGASQIQRRDAAVKIVNSIRQIIRAADLDSRRLALEHHITSPQLMSLLAIVEMAPVTASEVAKRIHLGPSTLVGVIDRLESKGLVQRQRSQQDRREVRIIPTEQGRALCARTSYPVQYSIGRAINHLTPDELAQAAQVLEHLAQHLGASEDDAKPMLEIQAIARRQSLQSSTDSGTS